MQLWEKLMSDCTVLSSASGVSVRHRWSRKLGTMRLLLTPPRYFGWN